MLRKALKGSGGKPLGLVKAISVVSNPEHPGARRLARSAAFWGWDHSFILKQDQLDLKPPYTVWYPSYRAEQLGQLDYIRQNEPEFLVYVDGYDTVFTGPPQELSFKKGLLTFGGDTVLFPEKPQMDALFPEVARECFRYINCGTIWGDARILSELAADYLQNSPETMVNQHYFNVRYIYELQVRQQPRLAIDWNATVALDLMLLQLRFFEMRGNRPHFKVADTYPLIVHVPGRGREFGPTAPPLPTVLEELYAV